MKKKYISTMMIAAASLCLMSCEDDRDDNPTLSATGSGAASEFVLNTPGYAAETVDLSASTAVTLSWSQPNWGFPISVNYEVQYSADGSFTVSTTEADADETGETVADYYKGTSTTSCSVSIDASEVATALESLNKWSESEVPDETTVYIRIYAEPSGESSLSEYSIISNVVTLTVIPYYIELSDADIEMWYLVGQCIGDGSWGNNGTSDIGTSLIPMSLVSGYEYDAKTGQGELTFTGYFTTDGFKLIKTPGSWDDQWGMSDGTLVKNDGGSSNITVSANGYYTLSLNTATDEISLVAADAPSEYDQMLISGDFNDWGTSDAMDAVNTVTGVVNHIWTYKLDASDGDTTCKFLTDSSWSTNWGGSDFPIGFGTQNGSNIPVTAGSWTIIFNDIDGFYYFVEN